MNIVKNPQRNRMGDEWLSDSLVVYIENDIFDSIDNDGVIQRFQNMKHVVDNYKWKYDWFWKLFFDPVVNSWLHHCTKGLGE